MSGLFHVAILVTSTTLNIAISLDPIRCVSKYTRAFVVICLVLICYGLVNSCDVSFDCTGAIGAILGHIGKLGVYLITTKENVKRVNRVIAYAGHPELISMDNLYNLIVSIWFELLINNWLIIICISLRDC